MEDARRPFNNHNPTTAKLAVTLCERLLSETTGAPGLVFNIPCPAAFTGQFSIAQGAGRGTEHERALVEPRRKLGTSYQEILYGGVPGLF